MSRRQQRAEVARARRRRTTLLWSGGAAVIVIAVVLALLLSGRDAASRPTAATLPRISPQEAYAALQSGEAVLYDVRIADAYEAGHAEGAISLPESEAMSRLPELPDDQLVIFYCT